MRVAYSMNMNLPFDDADWCIYIWMHTLDLLLCFYCQTVCVFVCMWSWLSRGFSRSLWNTWEKGCSNVELFTIMELIMWKSPQTEKLFLVHVKEKIKLGKVCVRKRERGRDWFTLIGEGCHSDSMSHSFKRDQNSPSLTPSTSTSLHRVDTHRKRERGERHSLLFFSF